MNILWLNNKYKILLSWNTNLEYYFTEMPFLNEKAQYFQRSFMQHYAVCEKK